MSNLIEILSHCQEILDALSQSLPLDQFSRRLQEIDYLANSPELWGNPKNAAELMKERQKLSSLLNKFSYFKEQSAFYQDCAAETPEELSAFSDNLKDLLQQIKDFEFSQMFQDPADDSPALLSITAGAGGLEAANWVTMLLRMYVKFADNNNFTIEELDLDRSEEYSSICIDSVSIRITGAFAYGFFKNEAGIHRLIRKSPFSSDAARHTSFAAVSVDPDIEDSIDIQILEKDLEETFMRCGGSGGQNVNKRSSGVRLKHLPSGIIINSRSEREQGANRLYARKMLKAKLYQLQLDAKKAEKDQQISQYNSVSFGYQRRSYILDQSQLVKDHKSQYETPQTDDVLNGNIKPFMLASLRSSH